MTRSILMVHGVGCVGAAFAPMAGALSALGYAPRTPTLFPALRLKQAPPPALNALGLGDYVDAIAAEVSALAAETGAQPILLGHSMGGLIVQALAARGLGAAAVLVTPAGPADCAHVALAPLYTFWNIIAAGEVERAYKVWRPGFDWGVLNAVAPERRAAIYAEAVFDSGRVYRDLGRPAEDPRRTAFIDENDIRIPVLTIAAGRDRATPAAMVRKVAAKYAAVGGDLLEYPNAAHWIIDEPSTDAMIGDIARWLDAKLGLRSAA